MYVSSPFSNIDCQRPINISVPQKSELLLLNSALLPTCGKPSLSPPATKNKKWSRFWLCISWSVEALKLVVPLTGNVRHNFEEYKPMTTKKRKMVQVLIMYKLKHWSWWIFPTRWTILNRCPLTGGASQLGRIQTQNIARHAFKPNKVCYHINT